MTRDEIITLLLRRAGQREGDTTLSNQLEAELPFIQESFEQNGIQLQTGGSFWPNFLLSEESKTSTEKGVGRVSLPSDFLSEVNTASLFMYDGRWKHLEKDYWDVLISNFSEEGVPQYYAFFGDYFYLFPVPDGVYDLKMIYYQSDARLDNTNENRWTKHAPGLVLASLGYVMASKYIYDKDLAKEFRDEQFRAAQQLYTAEVAREQANFDAVKGEKI